jgi:shikimate dehydrogenase
LGHPVAQSLSPRMQNAAFAVRGLDWEYVALDVESDGLEAAVQTFPNANVTAPYKRDVARILGSDLDSVNTIARGVGYSTDTAILEHVAHCHVPAIVGDGGAAAAFRAALPDAPVFSRKGAWPPDVANADLVIHATSVRDAVLFELHEGQTLIDLPYNPGSATGAAAAANGARVLDGREVLIAQGAKAFELWTGIPAPVEAMRRALGLPA